MFLANFRCICAITGEPRQAIKKKEKGGGKRKLDILLSFKWICKRDVISSCLSIDKQITGLAYIFLDRQEIQIHLLVQTKFQNIRNIYRLYFHTPSSIHSALLQF